MAKRKSQSNESEDQFKAALEQERARCEERLKTAKKDSNLANEAVKDELEARISTIKWVLKQYDKASKS